MEQQLSLTPQKIIEIQNDIRSVPSLNDVKLVLIGDSKNDIDFAAIVNNRISKIYFIETTSDIILRYILELRRMITIIPLQERDLIEHSTAFSKNVKAAMAKQESKSI
jgi:hypothetical protein